MTTALHARYLLYIPDSSCCIGDKFVQPFVNVDTFCAHFIHMCRVDLNTNFLCVHLYNQELLLLGYSHSH